MIANALASAGHTAYASMRDLAGQNAHQVEEVATYAKDHGVDLRTVELDVQSDVSVTRGFDGRVTRIGSGQSAELQGTRASCLRRNPIADGLPCLAPM